MTKSKVINVGVNDRKVDLFEGLYVVPNGVAYNSYIIADEKTAVLDTVDANFSDEWLNNVARALGGKKPDYLVVLHVEPDHAASVFEFVKKYPDATVVGNAKTFVMLEQFFDCKFENRLVVAEGDTLSLGEHSLTFVFAPMVHWPEVMVAYDASEKCLYSADAFGKFGALDCDEPWIDEARRYYIGIVGKYGAQVTALFKKLDGLALEIIRPLHGPVLTENLSYYLDAYTKWATYTPEAHGVLVAYSSIYGHTKAAAELMAAELIANGEKDVTVRDLARDDFYVCVAEAFKYDRLVIASVTYNGEAFPATRAFVDALVERNYQNRTLAIIENGSWAAMAAKAITQKLEKSKNLNIAGTAKVKSALNAESKAEIAQLAKTLAAL